MTLKPKIVGSIKVTNRETIMAQLRSSNNYLIKPYPSLRLANGLPYDQFGQWCGLADNQFGQCLTYNQFGQWLT